MGIVEAHMNHAISLSVLRCMLLFLIATAIIFSNIINIHILRKSNELQIFIRIMLINLSVAGLINGFFVCLPGFMASVIDYWPLGDVYCQISGVLNESSCTVTVWGLIFISLDRYVAIHYPIFYRNSNKFLFALLAITIFWILTILINVVNLVIEKNLYNIEMNIFICRTPRESSLFSDMMDFFVYFPGAIIMIVLYFKIRWTLTHVNRGEFNQKWNQEHYRNKKAMRILLICSIGYFVCWGPYTIADCLVSYDIINKVPDDMDFLIIWLANSNSFMNVLIYSGCSDEFRRHLTYCLQRCFQKTPIQPKKRHQPTSITLGTQMLTI